MKMVKHHFCIENSIENILMTIAKNYDICLAIWTWSVWWRKRFLRIFTIAFLLFLATSGSSYPAGQSFTLT